MGDTHGKSRVLATYNDPVGKAMSYIVKKEKYGDNITIADFNNITNPYALSAGEGERQVFNCSKDLGRFTGVDSMMRFEAYDETLWDIQACGCLCIL
jgi:hypothetical protein